jgi:transposase
MKMWRRGQAYSQDLRDRVLAADGESARDVADRLEVSASYVVKARQRRDRDGRLTAGRQRCGSRRKLADHDAAIEEHVREHADATLEERRLWLRQVHGVSVSIGTMWNTLRRLAVTRKKRPSRRVNGRASTSPGPGAYGTGCARGSIYAS